MRILEMLLRVLNALNFFMFIKEKEHFAYFWSFNGYEVAVVMDFFDDWFREETEIKNIKLIKNAVKISRVGGTTLRELMRVKQILYFLWDYEK